MDVIDENGHVVPRSSEESKRVIAGVLALIPGVGSLGIHKFILGYTKAGIIQLIISFVSCGILTIIPFIEGIIYLTKTDEEFVYTYQTNEKEWF